MALGPPKTNKYKIGTFELRIGPLNKAGKLTSAHSVGVVTNVTINSSVQSVDLHAGFPQKVVDTAITQITSGLTATLQEYSKRNINVLLANNLTDYETSGGDVNGTIDTTSAIAAGATSLTTNPFTGTLSTGDIVVIYDTANSNNVSICRVASYSSNALVLDADTPIVTITGAANTFSAGSSVAFYKAATIAGGAASAPVYFSVQLISLDRGTGRPVGYNIWKAAIASGLSASSGVTEFASTNMELKFLEPAAADYGPGGPLAHLAEIISSNPVFLLFDVPDAL
jgi:hypothetical protein